MALTERRALERIEVLEDGTLQVKHVDIIERDGVEISRVPHRATFAPGDDLPADAEDRLHAVAGVVWTPDVTKAHKDKIAALAANQHANQGKP